VKIESTVVEAAINNARELINSESDLSPALRSSMEVLLLVITLLFNLTTLNSKNSSKPPARDPNRLKSSPAKSSKPSGAQLGHVGKTLMKIDDPDEVEDLVLIGAPCPKETTIRWGSRPDRFSTLISLASSPNIRRGARKCTGSTRRCSVPRGCYEGGAIWQTDQSACGLSVTVSAITLQPHTDVFF
jgi:hypothetical protein